MKINQNILSIPPYISTNWSNVESLRMKEKVLIITLKDQSTIEIPDLDSTLINSIFTTHAHYLEQSHSFALPFEKMEVPFHMAIGSIDSIGGSLLQHDQAQTNAPNIPIEILEKIISITKIISPDETLSFPKPEPHCNCMHCQIGRVVHQMDRDPEVEAKKEPLEETVTDKDLNFQQWEIHQQGNQLYTVTNKLDPIESYSVFLGEPVGCTCGKQGCEHIIAVLKS